MVQRFPELRREFDLGFADALTYLPDCPGNTIQSIRLIKGYIRDYFLERGNTFPPKYLLKRLFLTYTASTKKLLEKGEKNRNNGEIDDYFP